MQLQHRGMVVCSNRTELSAQEFRDSLLLRYGRAPPNLPSCCDGCGQKFSVRHALECPHGGLIIGRHNEVRDELGEIAALAFAPNAIRDEPKIFPSHGASTTSTPAMTSAQVLTHTSKNDKERGDLLIRGLWTKGTDCIIDVRITDTDAKSYVSCDPMAVLAQHERAKKKKYLQPCLAQRRTFCPFITSCNGLLGKEATRLLQRLALRIAKKTGRAYSKVCGIVRARMSIAIVRATHLCLRGSRIPTTAMSRRPAWLDGAGLGLFH